jgi:hypothetical protein
MNVFDRENHQREFLNGRILDCWSQYRLALRTLVASYNAGNPDKAELLEQDGAVHIFNRRGFAPDQYRIIVIRIRVTLDAGVYKITAIRERYHDLPTTGSVSVFSPLSAVEHIHTLSGDFATGETWLLSPGDNQHRTAFEAAEAMLHQSLAD